MKILYGVQATGNGHITRARTMARELKNVDVEVDYVFTGRERDQLFNMEPFGNYRHFQGLTFVTEKGRVRYFKTAMRIHLLNFIRDITSLDLSDYDLVLTDFEPVTAWAARLKGMPTLGLGHQYAFRYDIPVTGRNPVSSFLLEWFAPARVSLGLHWHHFNQPILPPVIEPVCNQEKRDDNKILVYLPFEDLQDVVRWLGHADRRYEFYIYCDIQHPKDTGNFHLRPFSRTGFLGDLANCTGVISNAGFELASESISLGKKILAKPLKGQMEQESNALALRHINCGHVMQNFDVDMLNTWLALPSRPAAPYPNVAQEIVQWILNGLHHPPEALAEKLWPDFSPA